MYYVRKLTKPFNYNKIQSAESIDDIDSDIIKQELSTKDNTLSFWRCEDLNKISDTMKAIVLSTSEISKSKFIIIDSDIIGEYELDVNESPGKTGYKGFERLHIDICNLNYKRLGTILEVYKKVFEDSKNTHELPKDEVRDLIVEVIQQNLLDKDEINPSLMKDISKLADRNSLNI